MPPRRFPNLRFKRALLPDYVAVVILVAAAATLFGADLVGERQKREYRQASETARPATAAPTPAERDDRWLEFHRRQFALAEIKYAAFCTGLGAMTLWIFSILLRAHLQRRRRADPQRPALPGAGRLVADLAGLHTHHGTLTARARRRWLRWPDRSGDELVIDARRRTITFRGFTFVTALTGNCRTAETVLEFAEVLGGERGFYRGRAWLTVRTTRGQATVTDNLSLFGLATALLLDIAEANRLDPDGYRAALAREPNLRRWRDENAPPPPPVADLIRALPAWIWAVLGAVVFAGTLIVTVL